MADYTTEALVEQRVQLQETVEDEQTTHAAADGADTLVHENVQSVSWVNDTQGQGGDDPDYAATTDYLHEGDTVSWSPSASQPATGATYFVTYVYQALSSEQIAANIDAAASIIDAFCAGRYDLPFSTVPALVRTLATDIAAFYCARDVYAATANDIPDRVQADYDRAMELLRMLGEGTIALVDSGGTVVTTDAQIISNTSSYGRTTNLDDSENWALDEDRLDDIADERS